MARLLLSTVAGLAALSFAGVASAAYNPSLLVGDSSPRLGAKSSVRIFLRTPQLDDPTGMVTLYVARGYDVTLGQSP